MDSFSGAIPLLRDLLASSLIILELMAGTAADFLGSFTMRESPHAQISLSVEPSSAALSTTTKSISPATSTPKVAVSKKVATEVPVATAKPASFAPLTPLIDPEVVNTQARAALVNILCTFRINDSLRSISGSGVIVDARGVVLTNAHIAQYFLLKDYPSKESTECVIRTGSPATPLYHATLMYLPLQWVEANASQITAEHGVGTGEYDYAFLKITSRTDPSATLPSSFFNLAMSGTSLDTGEHVLVAGYPAGFLDGQTIQKSLYATSAYTKIGQLYTFNSPTNIDVVSLGGTVVAQGGSSGGAVIRTYDGKLSGLISTATTGDTTASRDLRAITIGYINRHLTDAGYGGIVGFLSSDHSKLMQEFEATTASKERQLLIDAIKR